METVTRRLAMARLCARWRAKGLSVGFVPTMGALHAGHASLIAKARADNERVAVSIFVNPTQFGPKEDFGRYPRAFPADRRLCAAFGADAVYHPSVDEVYPEGFSTSVSVAGLSERLCGAFRPGHFRGVATVVLKLLETVRPARAYFGEKDFQQLTIVRRMVSDLDLATEVVGCPTVREPDGLALSSRNRYLSPKERALAPRIHHALLEGARAARRGGRTRPLLSLLRRRLGAIPGARLDYVSLVDCQTLEEPARLRGMMRLLTAVRLGRTRLIDNVPVSC